MKRSSLFLRSIIAFSFAVFALTSCDDSTTGGGTSTSAPILELLDGTGSPAGDITVAPGETLTFTVRGTSSGDNPMQNVKFLEGGSLVADYATRITIDGSSATSSNVLLPAGSKESFEWVVTWTAHTDEAPITYEIEIVDEAGNSDKESIIVNTVSETVLNLELVSGGPTGNSIASDATLTAGAYMRVTLAATKGSYPLAYLEVQEDNTPVDVNRLYFTDVSSGNEFSANPVPVEGDGVDGFTQDVLVKIHDEEGVTKVYSFLVTDTSGDVDNGFAFAQLSITTQVTSTPISGDLVAKLLFNQSGPGGKGALDLDFGFGTGVTSDGVDATPVDAEIRDMGNDGDGNWLKQIAPMNDATLKRLSSSAEFPVDFATTSDVETIVAAYNDATSTDITLASPGGVIQGDMFVIERGGVYYLIVCTNINDEAGNENDYYEFNIKY